MKRLFGRQLGCVVGAFRLTSSSVAQSDVVAASPPTSSTAAPSEAKISEADKWWPVRDHTNSAWGGRVKHNIYSTAQSPLDGMIVPELKQVPDPKNPEQLSFAADNFLAATNVVMAGDILPEEKRFPPPPPFDPALDEIDDNEFHDSKLLIECAEAAEQDKKRLQELGNPLTVEDQLDYLLAPHRDGIEIRQQRAEFNGFLHWGLLYAANIALDEERDARKAHQFINRYLRDIDLFEQWLKHPKVMAHMKKKFNVELAKKFDKLLAMTIALFIRSKIQTFEADYTGSLKSLVGAAGMIHEGGKMDDERHRRILGAILGCRGMIYGKLTSWERAEEDFTVSLNYLPKDRAATIYQLRAEAREALGKLDEARQDEELAADIWENAETIYPGLDHEPVKWVL